MLRLWTIVFIFFLNVNHVFAATPIAEYRFEQNYLDSSGSGFNGTSQGATINTGKVCDGAEFNVTELTQEAGVAISASATNTGAGFTLAGVKDLAGSTTASWWNSGSTSGWVQVDLGASYSLKRIEIYGSPTYPQSFTVSVSNDGSTWSAITGLSYVADSTLTYASTIGGHGRVLDTGNGTLTAGTTARYVRYTAVVGANFAYVKEIAIWGSGKRYVQANDAAALQLTTNYTISAWIKTSKVSGTIVSKITSGSPWTGYVFGLGPDSGGKLSLWSSGATCSGGVNCWTTNTDGSTVNDGNWHHVAATVNGTSVQFYVDGVANGSAKTLISTTGTSTAPLSIGLQNGASAPARGFNGNIDEVLLFNSTLSASEITSIYSNQSANLSWNGSPSACAGSKVAEYHFEGNFNDSSGNNLNGTTTEPRISAGKVCHGMATDYNAVTVTNNALLQAGTNYTLMAWINTTNAGGHIIHKYSSTAPYPGYSLGINANSKLSFWNGGHWYTSTGASVNNGMWRHVAAVVSGNTLQFYVDGQPDGGAFTLSDTNTTSTVALNMGYGGFKGQIDEAQIYPAALTASAIAAGYANQRDGKNWDGSATSCAADSSIGWLYNSSGYKVTQNGKTANVTVSAGTYVAGNGYYQPTTSAYGGLNPTNIFQMVNIAGTTTITFDRPVVDPHIAIFSLGQPSSAATFTFNQPFTLVAHGTNSYLLANPGFSYSCSISGNTLTGNECNGVVKLKGVFTSLSFNTSAENWFGFNVGVAGVGDTASLLGQYRFEESASWNGTASELKDSSGNNRNGKAIGSLMPAPENIQPAIPDSGTCGYAEMKGPKSGGGAFQITGLPVSVTAGDQTTVSYWMYWDGTTDVMPIGWDRYDLEIGGVAYGTNYFGFNTANSDVFGTSSAGLSQGWHHVVASFTNGDATKNKLYIDGVRKDLSLLFGAMLNTNAYVQNTLQVGGWTKDAGYRFSGKIDEVKVYNGILTDTQVAALYTEKHNCETGISVPMIAQYRFEEGVTWNGTAGELKDTAGYTGGPFNGKAIGTQLPTTASSTPSLSTDSSGKGTCGYANMTGPANATNGAAFTALGLPVSLASGDKTSFSLWVKWNGITNATLLGWNSYELVVANTNLIGFNTGNADQYYAGTTLSANQWYHIAGVINNLNHSKNELYINGVKQTLTQTGSPVLNNAKVSSDLRIGNWQVGGGIYTLQGAVDEVKIFNGGINQNDVNLLYAERHNCATGGATLLAEYRFEEQTWTGAADELKDSSGNGRDGNAIGTPLPTPGVSNPAKTGATGTCGYANMPGPWTSGGAFDITNLPVNTTSGAKTSVSFWMYWDGTDQVLPIGWNRYDLAIAYGAIGFNTSVGDVFGMTIPSNLAKTWHHVVAVFVNGNVQQSKLYIDGNLQSLTQQPGYYGDYRINNGYAVVASTLRVGGWTGAHQPNDYRFSGRIDEVKVYSGELSQAEVSALYAETHPCTAPTAATLIAEYHFEDVSWNGTANELKDSSGNNKHGIATGTPFPTSESLTPAKLGPSGTCGYAKMLGPFSNGGTFIADNLPISTAFGAQTTLSFWMYWDGTNNVKVIDWQFHNLTFLNGDFGFNTSQNDLYGIPDTGLANGWHHVIAVFNNQKLTQNRLYIDGVAQILTHRAQIPRMDLAQVNPRLTIGGNRDSNHRFTGFIDEMKIFNGGVTAEQVYALYNETHSCTPVGPLVEYRFEDLAWDGTANELVDSSGNNRHATAASSGAFPAADYTSPAKPGTTGTCGYANMPPTSAKANFVAYNLPLSTAADRKVTVSFWMYWKGTISSIPITGIHTLFAFHTVFGFNVGNYRVYGTPHADLDNGWHHVTAVFANGDYTKNKLYIDGEIKSLTLETTEPFCTNNPASCNFYLPYTLGKDLNIGGGGNFQFNGYLDEVKVYDRELTQSEITTLFNETHLCYSKPIAEYHFEEPSYNGAAGELKDSSGNDLHGTASIGPNGVVAPATTPFSASSSDPAKPGASGTCGYATANSSGGAGGAKGGKFTVNNLPVNLTNGGKNTVTFWMYWDGSTGVMPIDFGGYNIDMSPSWLGFNSYQANIYGYVPGNTLIDGWHHVAAVFTNGDGIKNRLYIDGVSQPLALIQGSVYPNVNVSSTLSIGSSQGGTYNFGDRLDELKVFNKELTPSEIYALYNETHSCLTSIDHLRISHTGSGVTCIPSKVTIHACAGSDYPGGCSPNTSGISGKLIARGLDGTVLATVPFAIAVGATSTTVDMQVTSAQQVFFTFSNLSKTPTGNPSQTCWIGSQADCRHTVYDSGLVFTVNDHYAGETQNFTVSAVKKADNSLVCVPAFTSPKNVNFTCDYINPTTGTLPVKVAGVALNSANNANAACDAAGNTVSLSFNSSGVASTSLVYNDVGSVMLTATYQDKTIGNDGGLLMTGSDSFIAAPKSFGIVLNSATPIKAGATFNTTVTAKDANGNKTPNFGNETPTPTVTMAHTNASGAGSSAGSFSPGLSAFANGVATSNSTWSEVGKIDLSVSTSNYLNSGLSTSSNTGTAGAIAPFIPDHFDTEITSGNCSVNNYIYSGQPFGLKITAKNTAGGTTTNYSNSLSLAKAGLLSDANNITSGSFNSTLINASSFSAGIANLTHSWTFSNRLTAPVALKLRAVDIDSVTSATGTEATANIRSGRAHLFNKNGSEYLDLPSNLLLEYWNGTKWSLNSVDTCTTFSNIHFTFTFPTGTVFKPNNLSACETALTVTGSSPSFNLSLSAPNAGNRGWTKMLLNLDSTTTSATDDNKCITPGAAGGNETPANQAWLQYPWPNGVNNPTATMTFGIVKPTKVLLKQEAY